MTDFPTLPCTPTHIPIWSKYGCAYQALGGTLASTAWGLANRAWYLPFWLPFPYTVYRAYWANGSSVLGNADIGIYTNDGARLWSSGATARSGASALQYVAVSPELLLVPGRYFLALAINDTTNAFFGVNASRKETVQAEHQDSALPLPAAATFSATVITLQLPVCGITRTASGF